LRGSVADQRTVMGSRARQHVIDHDGGDGGDEAERGRKQSLGNTGRHDGEVRRMRLRDADEAVHDAPNRAEQADKGRCGADRGQDARAARNFGDPDRPRHQRGSEVGAAAFVVGAGSPATGAVCCPAVGAVLS